MYVQTGNVIEAGTGVHVFIVLWRQIDLTAMGGTTTIYCCYLGDLRCNMTHCSRTTRSLSSFAVAGLRLGSVT